MFEEPAVKKSENIDGKSTSDPEFLAMDLSAIMIDVVRLPMVETCQIMSCCTRQIYDNPVRMCMEIMLSEPHKK